MTASLQPESKSPSRRALLAGALGGLGALAAGAFGRPARARAADGGNLIIGQINDATTETSLSNNTTGADTLTLGAHGGGNALNAGTNGSGYGVYATSGSGAAVFGHCGGSGTSYGVYAESGGTSGAGVFGSAYSQTGGTIGVHGSAASPDGIGVQGDGDFYGVNGVSGSGIGARGHSDASYGVIGRSGGSAVAGVLGRGLVNAAGVYGASGPTSVPNPPTKTGVYGYAAQDSAAKGVWGDTTSGHGVHGSATSGFAGYFAGKVYTTKWYELTEISAPAAPGANKARLFLRVSGTGKTQLCVRFQSGAVQVIKTEP
jgi:hypothetical protein